MNKSNNQPTGIHCKVICDDQMRRFQFSGTEFSSLQHQVNQLLGLTCEFVLKYKDNEGDMITISSTEELACAIEISQKDNKGLFRLTVYLSETSTCPIPSVHVPVHPEHGRDFCQRGRGHGGKWGGRGWHGCHEGPSEFRFGKLSDHNDGPDSSEHPFKGRCGKNWSPEGHPAPSDFENPCKGRFAKRWCHEGGPDSLEHPWKGRFEKRWSHHGGPASSEHPCRGRFEKRREKITFKRDLFKAYLSSLEQMKDLSPEEEMRKQMLQAKVQRLDSILARFSPPEDKADYLSEKSNSCPQKETPVSEDPEFCPPKRMCQRKFEKRERKCEKREHKKEKKETKYSFLSEEAKAEITTLKSQIKVMKPSIWAIQEQLKTKKSAVRAAYDVGELAKIPELRNEIKKLKQEKRAKKEQIAPLCQRVHQLKSGK